MTPSPSWLPIPMLIGDDWETFKEHAYQIFLRDLISRPRATYQGMEVLVARTTSLEGKEDAFWHLITKTDSNANTREPDEKRAAKVCWIRPIIENCNDSAVRCFDFEEKSRRIRTYLWLIAQDYLVIVEKKVEVAYLVTAYHVDPGYRARLHKKYSQRLA